MSFEDICKKAQENGKTIKPVNHRSSFTFEGNCPFCGAPHNYLYDNNNKGKQFLCKACKNTFTVKTTVSTEIGIYCPHCKHKLSKQHDRKGYIVYYCPNNDCSYYKQNKHLKDNGFEELLLTSSKRHRVRYHYREFKFDINTLKKAHIANNELKDLSKIHVDESVLGLALTYYVNYGLSSRKTALILKEVHGIKISHQTIMNYAKSVSDIIKPIVDNYAYKLGNVLTGDETYIKVRGKNHHVFFWSDPVSKIITSYQIYKTRDTQNACQSIFDCLSKYKSVPEDLMLITDANPIYNAAQLFYHINGTEFTLKQVTGVKNKDEVSKEYRPYKQIEERLNRTFKQNYYGTNGYHTLSSANSYMVLYVCYFNFLRQNSSLGYKTPVSDFEFKPNSLIQDRWLQLIQNSIQYYS